MIRTLRSSAPSGFAVVSQESGGFAIVHRERPPLCVGCARLLDASDDVRAPQITSIERKADKMTAWGRVLMNRCPYCGMAVEEINRVVPIELQGITCDCGGKEFRFTIRSLKPNKAKDPTEWSFDLDVTCISCRTRKLRGKILSFFRLKRIKIGATGVDLEVFPEHKS
jgi:hypothetical protein